ncbi:hypothetical protein W822_22025 [Advenella kashmirensis W13003]|uniref:Uncharacterized protein n=1 Tax=Advenella kashmirensis W13003 TaxID=1424334 RepID=V8QMN7_9BURK|nr:hypothetical protein [Advenella kashmirensis]ETF00550.1 hypothetical protein W822_22025 [Advenella kashmirensis W13003]
MATVIKLFLIVLIVWWIGRFFSATLYRLWAQTIGTGLHWITHNGSIMMRWVLIVALLLGLLVVYQWP